MVRPIPPRPDPARDEAIEHMKHAEAAARRATTARSRALIKDAIVSARFFLTEAEKALSSP